jgi:site-specific DNA recombinase
MILTKSISRFARNTVTLLEAVRELKSLGVDIFFEEQNIHTMSAEGELMLTILASYAQEESLSASENQKWRIRKGFENGELLNWRFLLGYRISKDGITVDEDAAPIVREVFDRVIARESFSAISRDLNARGFTCALGGKWCAQRIRETVSNEKYTGNAMLQKRYRNNHLEKKLLRNTGELTDVLR